MTTPLLDNKGEIAKSHAPPNFCVPYDNRSFPPAPLNPLKRTTGVAPPDYADPDARSGFSGYREKKSVDEMHGKGNPFLMNNIYEGGAGEDYRLNPYRGHNTGDAFLPPIHAVPSHPHVTSEKYSKVTPEKYFPEEGGMQQQDQGLILERQKSRDHSTTPERNSLVPPTSVFQAALEADKTQPGVAFPVSSILSDLKATPEAAQQEGWSVSRGSDIQQQTGPDFGKSMSSYPAQEDGMKREKVDSPFSSEPQSVSPFGAEGKSDMGCSDGEFVFFTKVN